MIAKISVALLSVLALDGAVPGGPIPGWTVDSRTATIRAVTGIPGALRLADPLTLPNGIAAAEFSASGDIAVAITTDQPAHLLVVSSLRAAPVVADLGEVADDARILALNQKGTAAILHTPSLRTIRFVKSIDATPALSDAVSTVILSGPITAGLLESSGTCAILGTGSLETLCADGSSRRVIPETGFSITALAFGNEEKDLWAADTAGKQVFRVSGYAQPSHATVVMSQTDGLLKPIALALSQTGQMFVADAEAQALFLLDETGASIRTVPLDVVPSQLRPLTDRSLLLLNTLDSLPFTLFAAEGMRTYFIPAN